VGESNKGVYSRWSGLDANNRVTEFVTCYANEYDALQSQLARETQRLASLTQQRDELEADAARYLWLEERAPIVTATPEGDYCVWQITFHSPYGVKANECDLDEAIDAALTPAQEAQT
jgi:hypothetical protein